MPNIEQIRRGQFPLARDWNALADRYNAGSIGLSGFDVRRRLLAAGLVVIKNTSGSDRARFDCMQLGDCTQTIDDAAQVDVIFEATTAAADETPVILQEPIANNQFGIGAVFGVTLAKLATAGAATDVYGTPNGTNHNLDCGSAETTIKILSAPSTGAASLRPVLIGAGGGSTALYRFTLNAALSGGSADADILEMSGTDTGIDASVQDPLGIFATLTTNDAGICLRVGGAYYVIQAPCPA